MVGSDTGTLRVGRRVGRLRDGGVRVIVEMVGITVGRRMMVGNGGSVMVIPPKMTVASRRSGSWRSTRSGHSLRGACCAGMALIARGKARRERKAVLGCMLLRLVVWRWTGDERAERRELRSEL